MWENAHSTQTFKNKSDNGSQDAKEFDNSLELNSNPDLQKKLAHFQDLKFEVF